MTLVLLQSPDGSQDLHLDATEAGYLRHALCQASPRGSHECVMPHVVLRVHVHSEQSPAPPAHEPIEAK